MARESPDKFFGLRKEVFLCKGAQVYLTLNLNTKLGLYNSSPGTIIDIIYEENANI
jgi:hypothetical protein